MRETFFARARAWVCRYGFFAACLLGILGLGVYARWVELAWHFSNVDDMAGPSFLLNFAPEKFDPAAISRYNTSAPFVFFFMKLLIRADQTYRDFLFWARVPSCVAGTLGLFGVVCFYRFRDGLKSPAVLLAAALLAFSWENIAYAKQSYDYAIGVMAVVGMMALLLFVVQRERLSWGVMLGCGGLLALFGTMQYLTLLFVPAFYFTVILSRFRKNDFRDVFQKCVVSAMFFALLFGPVGYFLLSPQLSKSVRSYSAGFQNEYLCLLPQGASWFEGIRHAAAFFGKNFGLVFATRLGFSPEGGWAYQSLSSVFLLLFATGILAFFRDRRPLSVLTGAFSFFSVLVWFALIGMGRLPFGPTRHTLIFLPVFAVVSAQGFELLFGRDIVPKTKAAFWRLAVGYGLILVLMTVFVSAYGTFLSERRDPFREDEIVEILERYQPGHVFFDARSVGIPYMKRVQGYLSAHRDRKNPFEVIARVSRYPISLDLATCEALRGQYNEQLRREGRTERISHPCSDYEVVFSKSVPSEVQVNFSRKIKAEIFTNAMYLHIARLKKEEPST